MSPALRGQVIAEVATVTVLSCPRGLRGFDPDYVDVVWREDVYFARPDLPSQTRQVLIAAGQGRVGRSTAAVTPVTAVLRTGRDLRRAS
jgi:hypothetical protein